MVTGRRESDLSARFTPAERERVDAARARRGMTVSEFLREAVLRAADQTLGQDPLAAFGPSLGAIDVAGDFARNAKDLYTESLLARHGATPWDGMKAGEGSP